MKFIINPNKTETENHFFNSENTMLKFKPFVSNVRDLIMILENANGSIKKIPIRNTNSYFNETISGFGYMRFEYSFSDKEYTIELDVH